MEREKKGPGAVTKDELIDRLAVGEHERWGHWQRQFIAEGFRDASGVVVLSAGAVARLERLASTPWADLPEEVKEYTRAIVRNYWHFITQAVEEADGDRASGGA